MQARLRCTSAKAEVLPRPSTLHPITSLPRLASLLLWLITSPLSSLNQLTLVVGSKQWGLQFGKFSLTANFKVFIQMPLLLYSLTHSSSTKFPSWFYFLLYFIFRGMGCVILVPPPGIEPRPMAVKAWSPNLWIIMQFPWLFFFLQLISLLNIVCDSFVMSIVHCLLSLPASPWDKRFLSFMSSDVSWAPRAGPTWHIVHDQWILVE